MKERPILFSEPMVRAILAGKKTQTRRVIKGLCPPWKFVEKNWSPDREYCHLTQDCYGDYHENINPYGQPGDELYVRETFRKRASGGYLYRADCAAYEQREKGPWKPSIHMPREASRITLRIKDVSPEPLNAISEADARAEGVGSVSEFRDLWESINGAGSWERNPFVWAIQFELLHSEVV
jgi:hypothetical protein